MDIKIDCIFSIYYQHNGNQNKRTRTCRNLGESSSKVNKDHFFENDSERETLNTSSPEVFEISNSENSLPKETSNDCSATVQRAQISRIEAKLDHIKDVMLKIQHMVISLATSSKNASATEPVPNFLSEFPLMTDESIAKFEEDLKDSAFRHTVVGIDFFFDLNL